MNHRIFSCDTNHVNKFIHLMIEDTSAAGASENLKISIEKSMKIANS